MTAAAKHTVVLRIGFALLVAAYFINSFYGWRHGLAADAVKTLPVLFLCIMTWGAGGFRLRLFPAALLFSAIGDLFGELGMFIPQIAIFAVAHILYAVFFFRRLHLDRLSLSAVALLAIAGLSLGAYLIPHIGNPLERVLCGAYIFIISVMAASATLQRCPLKWLYVAAALIFMASDATIAFNKFVGHIPHAGVIIMTTYFAAQYIFARLYIEEQFRK